MLYYSVLHLMVIHIRLWCVLGTQRLRTLQVMGSLIRLWRELLQVTKLIVWDLSIFDVSLASICDLDETTI